MDNNNNTVRDRQRIVISIAEYVLKLWKWLPVIICWAALCSISVVTLFKVFREPVYTAETKIYMLSRLVQEEMDRFDMSDMQVSTQMANDSMLVLKNEQIAEKVIANLKIDSATDIDMTANGLLGMVDVSREDDSLMITITATNPDPYLACDIANSYRITVMEELESKLMARGITTVEEAIIPLEHSGRSDIINAAMGGVLGVFSIVFMLFVLYAAFDAQREPEDIKEV